MGLAMHLKRRSGRYFVRVRVPVDMQKHERGRKEIVAALGTADPAEAKRAAPTKVEEIRARWDALRDGRVLTSRDVEEALRDALRDRMETWKEARVTGERPIAVRDGGEALPEDEALSDRLADLDEALREGDYSGVQRRAEAILDGLGVKAAKGSPSWNELCRGLLAMSIEHLRVERERVRGNLYETPRYPLNPALMDADASSSVPTPKRAPARAAGRGPTVAEIAARYFASQTRGEVWSAKTEHQSRATVDIFAEFIGEDRTFQLIDRELVGNFKELLESLPQTYGKSAEDQRSRIVDIAERAKNAGKPTLAPRTVKRHLSSLAGLFRWAKEHGLCEGENPALGFKFPKRRRASEERPMWTADALTKLFASPVWTGRASKTARAVKGDNVIKDEFYWLPLIGLYAGLRLEEAAGLGVDDVGQVEGVWAFDVRPTKHRPGLKSRAAVRKVPIHAMLIKLGLLDYVADMKAKDSGGLFPGMTKGGPDNRHGYKFSHRFSTYRRDIGLYERGLDFHALRHSFTTGLAEAGVNEPIIDALTGHEGPQTETRRYIKSRLLTIGTLREAVERINFGVDLSHLMVGRKGRRKSA